MIVECDIAVLGAGPAGGNAALEASERGHKVVLLDEQPRPGGQVWRAKSDSILTAPATPESTAGDLLRTRIEASPISHVAGARVWQIQRDDEIWRLQADQAGTVYEVRTRALVLATGAREHVVPVPGWTLPGVLGLAGTTAYMKQHLRPPGKSTVVSGTGPLVFYVASEIRRLGGHVTAVVTPNSRSDWLAALPHMLSRLDLLQRGAIWLADLMTSGVPIHWRSAVSQVGGEQHVETVTVDQLTADWSPTGKTTTLEADSLCLGHGLVSSVESAQLLGIEIHHNQALGGWVPMAQTDGSTTQAGLFVCGDMAGIRGVAAAELHGQIAGLSAALHLAASQATADQRVQLIKRHARAARFGLAMTGLSQLRAGLMKLATSETIICRCESLTRAALQLEIMDGAASTNAVKSSTRGGMGPCGGKYCQANMTRLIELSKGWPDGTVRPPTPRPPLRPISLGALAGEFSYDLLPIPKSGPQ